MEPSQSSCICSRILLLKDMWVVCNWAPACPAPTHNLITINHRASKLFSLKAPRTPTASGSTWTITTRRSRGERLQVCDFYITIRFPTSSRSPPYLLWTRGGIRRAWIQKSLIRSSHYYVHLKLQRSAEGQRLIPAKATVRFPQQRDQKLAKMHSYTYQKIKRKQK